MVLNTDQVRHFYDHFGLRQDRQGFYEDTALSQLLAHGGFEKASRVFEFGCGTGRFATRLLAEYLPPTATYLGIDLSPHMVTLATERLKPFGARCRVERADGSAHLPLENNSVDRLLSTYVLDLLPEEQIHIFWAEARRVLAPEGRLCLVSLSEGTTPLSRLSMALWRYVFRLRPQWVGGCRPIRLTDHMEQATWSLHYCGGVVAWAIPSEVVVAIAASV